MPLLRAVDVVDVVVVVRRNLGRHHRELDPPVALGQRTRGVVSAARSSVRTAGGLQNVAAAFWNDASPLP
jgi:hypothetical protein